MKITWWGHASATITLGGLRILTDPLFAPRLAHLRRLAPAVPVGEAAAADAVVLSHLHHDHLHVPSLRCVSADAVTIMPAGGRGLVPRDAVREMTPGAVQQLGGVRITAVPAHHDGRRLPGSHYRGPALGYLLEHDGVRVWFAGDTGLFDGLAELAPVDVALVPVGGWGPTLGPEHLSPAQAVVALELVGARQAVPIHYGTYWPAGLRELAPATFRRRFVVPGVEFASLAGPHVGVHVLAVGESVRL